MVSILKLVFSERFLLTYSYDTLKESCGYNVRVKLLLPKKQRGRDRELEAINV